MKTINKLVPFIILFVGTAFINAQRTPPEPTPQSTAQGALTQPIDMYLVWLGILAIFFIVFFMRNHSRKTA